jgi:hypothetical protein
LTWLRERLLGRRRDYPTNPDMVAVLAASRARTLMTLPGTVAWLGQDPTDRDDDQWYVAGYKRIYRAFIRSSFVIETVPDPASLAPYRIPVLALAAGGHAVLAFTDHAALHRCFPSGKHGGHETIASRLLCGLAVEKGDGVIINLGSEYSRVFDVWETAWAAVGMMPALSRPNETPELKELIGLLRTFLVNREIDSAYLTWAVDANDVQGFAIVLSPVGRWPVADRRALGDAFQESVVNMVPGVGLAIVPVVAAQSPDHGAMINLL